MRKEAGFTLIEIIVYLALFGILFTGAISSAYAIFESSGRSQTKAMLQEEGNFLIAKINWALSGAAAVNLPPMPANPAVPTEGSLLSVTKYDATGVTISVSGSDMQLQKGADTWTLNNSNVQIDAGSLKFIHASQSGSGANPENVETRFTLSARTPNGAVVSQDFLSTNYLRK